MRLEELIDKELLDKMIAEGYIGMRHHETEPLSIYNYTAGAQYDRMWNDATRQCRGLIVHDDGTVIARPWPKFHNYGEHDTEGWDPDERCFVTDKMDGSLGVLYPRSDGSYAIATRGSFTSDQALWATQWLETNWGGWLPISGITYLFEVIYPGNRIVVNYGDRAELVLLGGVMIESGDTMIAASMGFPGARVPNWGHMTLTEALAMEPRPNAEGIVLHLIEKDLLVKVKQEDYVALHRVITGVNEKSIWRILAAGGDIKADLIDVIPDEFHEWVNRVAKELVATVDETEREANKTYSEIVLSLPTEHTRKDFALKATQTETPALMFLLYDKKNVREAIWKTIEPRGNVAMTQYSEDTA